MQRWHRLFPPQLRPERKPEVRSFSGVFASSLCSCCWKRLACESVLVSSLGNAVQTREEDVVPRPPSNKAWVAVRVNRQEATTEVFVRIREVGPAGVNDPAPIAGVVGLKRARLAGLLFRDVNRFPENGGY